MVSFLESASVDVAEVIFQLGTGGLLNNSFPGSKIL